MSRRTCRKGRQHQCHMQGWGCKNLELLFSCRQRHVTPPACWACCDAPSSPQSPHLRHTAPTPRETAPLFSKPATGRQRGACVPRCSTPSHNMPKHTSPSRAPPIAQPPPPPSPHTCKPLGTLLQVLVGSSHCKSVVGGHSVVTRGSQCLMLLGSELPQMPSSTCGTSHGAAQHSSTVQDR
jgi:hypothetical protein